MFLVVCVCLQNYLKSDRFKKKFQEMLIKAQGEYDLILVITVFIIIFFCFICTHSTI